MPCTLGCGKLCKLRWIPKFYNREIPTYRKDKASGTKGESGSRTIAVQVSDFDDYCDKDMSYSDYECQPPGRITRAN